MIPYKYKCNKCGKNIDELDAIYLHKKIGSLEINHYYCKSCLQEEKEK